MTTSCPAEIIYKKDDIMQNYNCLICDFKCTTQKSLATHLRKHQIKYKEYYDKYIKAGDIGICLNCGKPTNWDKYRNYYYKFCSNSNKCYGQYVTNGNVLQDREQTVKTWKNTIMIRYGVDHISKVKSIRDRAENTNLIKYGVKYATQNDVINTRRKENTLNHKKYTLPSGKVIMIQGYEPQLLDYIFKNNLLDESDIDYSPKGIVYRTLDGTSHYYFPDFYVKSKRCIIECKSSWILKLQGVDIQKLKEEACKIMGYNYILLLDNDFGVMDVL